EAGVQNERRVRPAVTRFSKELEARYIRHSNVTENEIEILIVPLDEFQSVGAAQSGDDFVPFSGEQEAKCFRDDRFVIYDEQPSLPASHGRRQIVPFDPLHNDDERSHRLTSFVQSSTVFYASASMHAGRSLKVAVRLVSLRLTFSDVGVRLRS